MDTFFFALKRGLVATMFIVFAFVATYVPHTYNHVEEAHAGSCAGQPCATLTEQLIQSGILSANVVQTTATAGFTGSLWLKENVLDGIGWFIAKQIVSSMVQSIINWINSGFQGSPAFITDLKGFLVNVADQAIGSYIQSLGGIGSFICSPFRLDVQISVATQYAQGRAGGQTAPTCTLTGIINNIQSFIGGNFGAGGWDDWIDITSQPEVYTPYGAALSAQAGARISLINAQGEELTKLEWGDGFLSQKFCQSVSGFTGSQNCSIVKPGRVIADQLNKALGAGQDALITADEINEIIAALLGQLANTVMTGAAGLLGLSSGTGYTYSGFQGGSYLSQMGIQAAQAFPASASGTVAAIVSALSVQQQFLQLAQAYQAPLNNYTSTSTINMNIVQQAAQLAQTVITTTSGANGTIAQLNAILAQYSSGVATQQQQALQAYTNLLPQLYSNAQLNQASTNWPQVLQLP